MYVQGGNKVPKELQVLKNNKDGAKKIEATVLGIKTYSNTYSVIRYFL